MLLVLLLLLLMLRWRIDGDGSEGGFVGRCRGMLESRTDGVEHELLRQQRTASGRLVRAAAGRTVRGHLVEIGAVAVRVRDLRRPRRLLLLLWRLLLQTGARVRGRRPIVVVDLRRVVGEFALRLRTARLIVVGGRAVDVSGCVIQNAYPK